ncbi:24971_t:CDS:2 [Dentiscutata erythropus]|uniref:24971_t:CDS:1 n=1 Tax=Dentiscutata erythropus TaxID=1348616 RepID=A0A9N8VGG1_9GLOM|nr:24971_t:CDS:2 [Dentiscutata erythropus]
MPKIQKENNKCFTLFSKREIFSADKINKYVALKDFLESLEKLQNEQIALISQIEEKMLINRKNKNYNIAKQWLEKVHKGTSLEYPFNFNVKYITKNNETFIIQRSLRNHGTPNYNFTKKYNLNLKLTYCDSCDSLFRRKYCKKCKRKLFNEGNDFNKDIIIDISDYELTASEKFSIYENDDFVVNDNNSGKNYYYNDCKAYHFSEFHICVTISEQGFSGDFTIAKNQITELIAINLNLLQQKKEIIDKYENEVKEFFINLLVNPDQNEAYEKCSVCKTFEEAKIKITEKQLNYIDSYTGFRKFPDGAEYMFRTLIYFTITDQIPENTEPEKHDDWFLCDMKDLKDQLLTDSLKLKLDKIIDSVGRKCTSLKHSKKKKINNEDNNARIENENFLVGTSISEREIVEKDSRHGNFQKE